jgi:CRP-like cAMP-binding protein
MYEILTKSSLFRGLNADNIINLFELISIKEKKYQKDDIIAFHDDICRNLIIILEGSVKGEMIDFTGKTIKIEDIESPRTLAPAFLFGKNNRYPVTIVANNDVRILTIPRDAFVKLLQINEIVLKNYLDNISNRAQFLSNKIRFLSFQTIKGKIAHFILQLVKKTGSDNILLTKSQNELSELFGVTRPSIGRAIRELDNDGYIKADGRQISLLNKQGLSNLLR